MFWQIDYKCAFKAEKDEKVATNEDIVFLKAAGKFGEKIKTKKETESCVLYVVKLNVSDQQHNLEMQSNIYNSVDLIIFSFSKLRAVGNLRLMETSSSSK